jgi:hypothetical protein
MRYVQQHTCLACVHRIRMPACLCAEGACAHERPQPTSARTRPVDRKKVERQLINNWRCKWGEQDGERHDAIPPSLSCVQGQGGLERSKESLESQEPRRCLTYPRPREEPRTEEEDAWRRA